MDPKEKKQKLITSSETADPSLSEMNPKKKKQKLSKSETAGPVDLKKKKKKKKVSESQEIVASPSLSEEELREAMKKQNDVVMVLTGKVIASKAKNSNFVFSPASINSALTMAAAESGSITDELKAVFSEIANIVFVDGSANGGPKITAINGVWVEQSLPVDHSLKDLFENFFKATFTQVDFRFKAEKVCRELNKWASDNTNGLIKDIFPPGSVTRDTVRVFGNALYFKGAWKKPFDKKMTKENDFHLIDGKKERVPFMKSFKDQCIKVNDGFKVLRLPYRQSNKKEDDTNREYSMCFFLPDKKDGLENLVQEMTSTPGFVDNHIPRYTVEVGDFRIPKFKFSFMFQVSKEFDKLGLVSASLCHKACVEIDEEGAEAAAVTFYGTRVGCPLIRPPPPPKIDFVADHPFLFLIREDKTGTVLFAGQIYNPK